MLHRCACLQNFLKLSTDVNTFKILNRGGGSLPCLFYKWIYIMFKFSKCFEISPLIDMNVSL